MVEEATKRGYGTGRSLLTSFVNWQRRGLIAYAASKTSRRGGEGLWHERQLWIWLSLLHLRSQGAHLTILANVPIATWMLGVDGVETQQVQKVMAQFWGSPKPPPDLARSRGYRRQVEKAVDWMAAPGATASDRRRYRKTLAQVSGALPEVGVSARVYAAAAAPVLAPSKETTWAQRVAISNVYGLFEARALAMSQMPNLSRPTLETIEFWEWARRMFQRTWSDYSRAQPAMATDPEVGHLYDPPDMSGVGLLTWNGCVTLLSMLGIGLDLLRSGGAAPPGLEAPPNLRWWPSLSRGRRQ